MSAALDAAMAVRTATAPNPWVGAVVLSPTGTVAGVGATSPPGGPHAEVVALRAAGSAARKGTLVVTLEPCAHEGRTPPCTDAIVAAGVRRVVVGVLDPDVRVAGRGVAALRDAGVEVMTGLLDNDIEAALTPYLTHRRTGRPYVVCKLGATLDGMIAASNGASRWITGPEARADAHRLRAESDAIMVGAATVRRDDPSLTVRHVDGSDPLRVVLGSAPPDARVHPCLEWTGELTALLDHLGGLGVLQVLVEGGARVIRSLIDADLVDRFVAYVAPALLLGRDGVPMVAGPSIAAIDELLRMQFVAVRRVGHDLRLDLVPGGRIEQQANDHSTTSDTPPIRYPGEAAG